MPSSSIQVICDSQACELGDWTSWKGSGLGLRALNLTLGRVPVRLGLIASIVKRLASGSHQLQLRPARAEAVKTKTSKALSQNPLNTKFQTLNPKP